MELKLDFKFDAAHRLMHHKGVCHNIHGHTWKVRFTVFGRVDPATDMLVDFKDLKNLIWHELKKYDHALLLNECDALIGELHTRFDIVVVDGEPTCETLVKDLFNTISKTLCAKGIGLPVDLEEVQVWESETASAVYRGK